MLLSNGPMVDESTNALLPLAVTLIASVITTFQDQCSGAVLTADSRPPMEFVVKLAQCVIWP